MTVTLKEGKRYVLRNGTISNEAHRHGYTADMMGVTDYKNCDWTINGSFYSGDGEHGGNHQASGYDAVREVIQVREGAYYRLADGDVIGPMTPWPETDYKPIIFKTCKWISEPDRGLYQNNGKAGLDDYPTTRDMVEEVEMPIKGLHTFDTGDMSSWCNDEADYEAPIKGLHTISLGEMHATHSGVQMYGEARLPSDRETRKDTPIYSGFIKYFPLAMGAVAQLSKSANEVHNPGEELHWSKGKSNDHADAAARHLSERGGYDDVADHDYHYLHAVKLAWRAMADLQTTLESGVAARIKKGEL